MAENLTATASEALIVCYQLTNELAQLENVSTVEAQASSTTGKSEATQNKQNQIVSQLVDLTSQYLNLNIITPQLAPNLFEVQWSEVIFKR